MNKLDEFLSDRDEAFKSLDRKKIEAYCKKYSVPIPPSAQWNEDIFWASAHKVRIHIESMPEEKIMESKQWLKEHGFSEQIDFEDLTSRL